MRNLLSQLLLQPPYHPILIGLGKKCCAHSTLGYTLLALLWYLHPCFGLVLNHLLSMYIIRDQVMVLRAVCIYLLFRILASKESSVLAVAVSDSGPSFFDGLGEIVICPTHLGCTSFLPLWHLHPNFGMVLNHLTFM